MTETKKGWLRYREDWRTVVNVMLFYVGVALAWQWNPEPSALALLPVPLLMFVSFTCAVITHNTVHVPIFHARWANKLFQIALTNAYGHPVSAYVPGHNLAHHKAPQSARDSMRTTKMRFRWNFLNQLLLPVIVGRSIMKGEIDYALYMRKVRPRWFRQLAIETLIFVGFMVTVLILDWRKAVLYVMIPHAFAAWGIVGVNFAQHDGTDQDHPHNHSRNFVGRLENWFLFNNGFHGIHHEAPSMHWTLLPAAHAERIAPHIHPNLDRPSLLGYLFESTIWPGKRLRYDGTPLVLPPPVKDETWLPSPDQTPEDLGAEAEPA